MIVLLLTFVSGWVVYNPLFIVLNLRMAIILLLLSTSLLKTLSYLKLGSTCTHTWSLLRCDVLRFHSISFEGTFIVK